MPVVRRLVAIAAAGVLTAQAVRQLGIRYRLWRAQAQLQPLPPGAHVVVLGAGVVGLTAAYELCRQGYRVTIVERKPQVAAETSYANAGYGVGCGVLSSPQNNICLSLPAL